MDWIRSDFRLIRLARDVDKQVAEKLASLNIHTLEDLIALWDIPGLRQLIATDLQMDVQELDGIVASSRRSLPLEVEGGLLTPIPDAVLSSRGLGLWEPEDLNRIRQERSRLEGRSLALRQLSQKKINHIGRLRPISDQGSRNTSAAFATAAMLEFALGAECPKLSEQFLYFGAKVRDEKENKPGTRIMYAIGALEEDGVCALADWGYSAEVDANSEHQGPPPKSAMENAKRYAGKKGERIRANDVDAMREILSGAGSLGPRLVAFGFPVFNSWLRNPVTCGTGRICMPLPNENHIGGHCVTLVGFCDDRNWPGGGYFIFRNSWGENWAAKSPFGAGYGALAYEFAARYGWEAWTLEHEEPKKVAGYSSKQFIWALVIGAVLAAGALLYPTIMGLFEDPRPDKPIICTDVEDSLDALGKKPTADHADHPDVKKTVQKRHEPENSSLPVEKDTTSTKERILPKEHPPTGSLIATAVTEQPKDEAPVMQKFVFRKFDKKAVAERVVKSIKRSSGVKLELGEDSDKYVLYIVAADEAEMNEIADKILSKSGISRKAE